MLHQMTVFLRYRGYKGFLILVDEVENVLHLTPAARRSAYTIVRELIDNVDTSHGMSTTLLFFSGTPDLFDSDKGIAEYEALASRVLLAMDDESPNPSAPVVDIEAYPITKADYLMMADNIVALFVVAKPSRHVDKTGLARKFAAALKDGLPSPRRWVKTVVDLLDRSN